MEAPRTVNDVSEEDGVIPAAVREGPEYEASVLHESVFPGEHGQAVEAKLPQGSTMYYLFGPENGQRVVLVHGEQESSAETWLDDLMKG